MKAIILAAGYATRLYPLTKDRPKPLLQIGDHTIIDYLLDGFDAIPEIDTVYVVTNQKFAQTFTDWAENLNASGAHPAYRIKVVNDGTTSNETRLGAIADIQFVIENEHLYDDLLVAAGDNIFQFDFAEFSKFYQQKQTDVLVCQELNDPERLRQRGVVEFDDQQRVLSFEEKPQEPKSSFVCPALYLHPQNTLPLYKLYLDQGNNPDAPGHFIKWLYPHTPIHAFVMQKPAIDIGTLEVYERVKHELA